MGKKGKMFFFMIRMLQIYSLNFSMYHAVSPFQTLIVFFLEAYSLIYLEREREQGKGREKGRERIPSRLHTMSTEPDVGLESMKP